MDDITKILVIVLMLVFFILFVLIMILVSLKWKATQKERKSNNNVNKEKLESKVSQNYSIQSIFDFMEFDKIEDNMIIQKKGKKYLMIVKCKGINYDLMSEVEKVSVEQGFLQYLNTLRHQVQIYVQTRTVDLENSISVYKRKIQMLENKLRQEEMKYNEMVKEEIYTKEQLAKQQREVRKAKNLYEYGADIVNNTERMSLNRNILSKQYYIIIPYFSDEIGGGDYSKEEIQSMSFAELYTRAQSTINLLSVCGIEGKILDSMEISNLLYMAYNRDEAETYDLQKAIKARYDEMYTTAPNVIDKKIRALDRQIQREALEKANQAIMEVRQETQKERELKRMEQEYEESINTLAKMILDENESEIGRTVTQKAMSKIDKTKDNKKKEQSEEVEQENEKKATNRRPGRPRKLK